LGGRSAYSSIAELRDGSVAVRYERGLTYYAETMAFVRFRLDWLSSPDATGGL
jgi:hypothetical protein